MTDEQATGSEIAPQTASKLVHPRKSSLIFSVGCLYFGVKAKKIHEWEEHVTEMLNRLPRVSNINVSADVARGWKTIDGITFPITGYVDFKLTIPLPLQRQLLARVLSEHPKSYSIETYRVIMFYEYHGPVSFVIIDDSSAELWDSSDSIVIVREYLRKELPGNPDFVEFGRVGPSPFHGNFAVELNDQAEPVLFERTASRAYDDFVFNCSASIFTSTADAAEHVFSEIKDELSFYYYLMDRRNGRLRDASEVNALTGALVGIYEKKGIRAWARRLFTSSSKTRHLALKALTAEYDAQVKISEDTRNKDEIYSSDVIPYFSDEIADVMSEDYSGVISGAREVAGLLSEVRARQVEITSLFMSAVAGGVAGALISLLVH